MRAKLCAHTDTGLTSLWNRLRRALGLSCPSQGGEFARMCDLPPWNEGPWGEVGRIQCPSGQLVVADPCEFPTIDPRCGLVVDAPVGTHRLELQKVTLRGRCGQWVVRARVVWGDIEDVELRCIGSVGVDVGMISIADLGQIEQSQFDPDEEFPAAGLLGDDNYELIDPAEDGNAFLHVFTSGLGDGSYPVFVMEVDNRTSGILIDMTGLLDSDGTPVENR